MPEFPSITHVAVTVTDLERSARWYSELLAAEPVLGEDERPAGFTTPCSRLAEGSCWGCTLIRRALASGSMSTGPASIMWPSPVVTVAGCRTGPRAWTSSGLRTGGVKDAHYGSGVSFRDPDGIALEFFAPPS